MREFAKSPAEGGASERSPRPDAGDLEHRRTTTLRVQARLVVGRSNDPFEREADAIADRVVAALADRSATGGGRVGSADVAASRIQRGGLVAPAEGDNRRRAITRIQRRNEVGAAGGVVDHDTETRIRQAQRGGGSPLAAPVRAGFESALGADLGRIRLHTGRPAAVLNERLGASAFTTGPHVFFRGGLPDATAPSGQHLLAHEITHALQQGALASPRVQRVYEGAYVTKPAGASLHKSDRKQKAGTGNPADVRSGGLFGTGLKVKVPVGASLQVDFAELSSDGHYALAQHGGTIGYMNVANVANLAQIMATGPTLLAGIRNALTRIAPVSLVLLKPFIAAANQGSRDAVWQDAALMDLAQRTLSLDDYLGLLPLLRVLNKPNPLVAADPWGAYDTQTLGPMVDTVIRTHLAAYVGGAVGTGRHVEGEMSVVGDKEWDLAFKRQWTKPHLQHHMGTANAFVDVNQPERHIWIHNARGGPGTAIHEGIHKYASPVLRDELINTYRGGGADVCNLDEGTTEYFTRLAINTGALGYARTSYPFQFASVTLLVGKVGVGVLARAYFDGKFGALKRRFATKTGNRWADYAQALEAGQYNVADGLL